MIEAVAISLGILALIVLAGVVGWIWLMNLREERKWRGE